MKTKRWTSDHINDQTGRVVIVTGANSGIGFETAKALAIKGAEVVLASRSEERGTRAVEKIRSEIPSANIDLILLDLANLDSIKLFAETFRSHSSRLDLLINNAGIMNPPTRQTTSDGFEMQFGTNHLGHFALTLRLADLIVSSPGSRVVTVSSSAQNFGKLDLEDPQWVDRAYKGMQAYSASKIANMLFTLELQRRFSETSASSIAVAAHPGWTATNLQATTTAFRVLNPFFAMQPWQGALPTLYAATSTDVRPGAYYGPDGIANWRGYPAVNKPATQSTDVRLARRLWEISEDLVGYSSPVIASASNDTLVN